MKVLSEVDLGPTSTLRPVFDRPWVDPTWRLAAAQSLLCAAAKDGGAVHHRAVHHRAVFAYVLFHVQSSSSGLLLLAQMERGDIKPEEALKQVKDRLMVRGSLRNACDRLGRSVVLGQRKIGTISWFGGFLMDVPGVRHQKSGCCRWMIPCGPGWAGRQELNQGRHLQSSLVAPNSTEVAVGSKQDQASRLVSVVGKSNQREAARMEYPQTSY